MTGVKVKALEQAEGKALVAVDNGKEVQKLEAEAVLVATGRRPNTAGLNLEAAGVEIGPRGGIVTDDSLTTTAPHIYAMGDVRGGLTIGSDVLYMALPGVILSVPGVVDFDLGISETASDYGEENIVIDTREKAVTSTDKITIAEVS